MADGHEFLICIYTNCQRLMHHSISFVQLVWIDKALTVKSIAFWMFGYTFLTSTLFWRKSFHFISGFFFLYIQSMSLQIVFFLPFKFLFFYFIVILCACVEQWDHNAVSTGSVYTGVEFCKRLCGISIVRRYNFSSAHNKLL